MKTSPIRSEAGLTKATTINRLSGFFACCLLACLFCSNAEAKSVVSDTLPLYGQPKYDKNFKHFNYASPDAVKGGRIVIPAYGTFDNFNPFIFKGIASAETAALTLDTLGIVPADDYSTVYPLIAKQFELPDDNSFVGFILDEKAKFRDGSPILADDVIFSFNSLIEKGSPLYKVYYADVDRVEKINDRHIRFYFKKDSSNKELPLILSQIAIFSAEDWAGKDFAKPSLIPPLGSGPYRIEKFEPGKFVVLKRNRDYWAKDLPSRKGFFNFDEVRFDYYQDTTVTLQALFAGNIDMREEYIAKIWVTGYDNDVVKSGKVKKENLPHNQTAILQNFAFNIRRPKFQDKRVRQAIGLAFNFEWANEKLFYNQYQRLNSYYTNSEMAASGKPQGKELALLKELEPLLPPEVFGEVPTPPEFKLYEDGRKNLRRAASLLKEAGYDFVDGKMTHLETGQPLEFEVLSNTANGNTFTRVMLPFLKNLEKIGIKATFRNLEVNIFKNRLDNFDFDMAIVSFPMSQMPGNEQKEMWGSRSADIKGSFNLIGIKNPAADALLDKIVKAQDKESYIAALRALDRVLRHEYYMIPQWYSAHKRVAYRNRFAHPQTKEKVGFQPFSWWLKDSQGKQK